MKDVGREPGGTFEAKILRQEHAGEWEGKPGYQHSGRKGHRKRRRRRNSALWSSDLWPQCLPVTLRHFVYGEFSCIPGSPVAQLAKDPPCNAGDLRSIPGLGGAPGEGKGYTLQPGEFHGLYRPWVARVGHDLRDFHFTSCILFVNIWIWH